MEMQRSVWSPAEKKVARAAFQAAWARECGAVRRQVEAMLEHSSDPTEIWRVHDYLSRKRREVDEKYDYRYSVLTSVLGRLLAEGWVVEADITALDPEKTAQIKRIASMWVEG